MSLENFPNTGSRSRTLGRKAKRSAGEWTSPRAVLGKVQAQPGSSGPIETRTTFKIRKTEEPKLESIVLFLQSGKRGLMLDPRQLARLTLTV